MIGWARPSSMGLALGFVALLAACGGSEISQNLHNERGVRAIEEVVAPQLGVGALTVTCAGEDGLEFGDQFPCEALTESNETVLFVATVADGGAIDVVTLNLLTTQVLGAIEVAAIDVVQAEQGLNVSSGGFKCGEGPRILPPSDTLVLQCQVLHPETGLVHESVVRLTDLLALELTVEISEEPL